MRHLARRSIAKGMTFVLMVGAAMALFVKKLKEDVRGGVFLLPDEGSQTPTF
jgi:hypothetical protein